MSGSRSKTSKSSRARSIDQKLALKHKINGLKRYIKRMVNDNQAKKSLEELEKKLK